MWQSIKHIIFYVKTIKQKTYNTDKFMIILAHKESKSKNKNKEILCRHLHILMYLWLIIKIKDRSKRRRKKLIIKQLRKFN